MAAGVPVARKYQLTSVNSNHAMRIRWGGEAVPFSTGLAVLASAVFTLVVGIWPGWLLDAADTVTQYAR